MATGSNPVFGATLQEPRILGTSSHFQQSEPQNYDTFLKKKDTSLRLYKVNNTYYYRRRIDKKLFRVSLHTKQIKEAIKRKKILDLVSNEEMFKLETKDFKLMFEYDTEEELRTALESVKQMQIEAQVERFKQVKSHIEQVEKQKDSITFAILKDKFIAQKKKDNIVGDKSLIAYNGTFNLLIKYFKDKQLHDISFNDYQSFKDYLINLKTIKNKSINKHLMYTKYFVKFAKVQKLITENETEGITFIDEIKDEIARKKEVRNYTSEEVRSILNYDYGDTLYNKIFKILVYSGMRPSDLYDLKNDNIKTEAGIHYFNITDGKTLNSIRKVPIHNEILSDVLSINFPLFNNLTHDAIGKKLRRQLYKVIDEKSDFNLYTLRATFIEKAIAYNIDMPNIYQILQDVVGHDKGDKIKLTNDIYGKNIPILVKQELVNRVNYSD